MRPRGEPGGRAAAGRASGSRWWVVWLGLAIMLAFAPSAQAQAPAYEVVSHAAPTRWCPGETRRVAVTLRNVGPNAWSPEHEQRVSYHWRDGDGRMVHRDGLRTDFDAEVAAGAEATVRAKVTAPSQAGSYVLVWRVLTEGEGWFPEPKSGASVAVTVQGSGEPLAWSYSAEPLPEISAKDTTTLKLRVTNRGCATWSADDADRMSYRWFSSDGTTRVADGRRTSFGDEPIGPGEHVDVELELAGPPSPGRYQLRLSPIRERVAWFDAPKSGDASIDVEVRNAALQWDLIEADWPEMISASAVVDVDVVLANIGTKPWASTSGDRLSYHWVGDDGTRIEGMRTPLPQTVAPGERVTASLRVRAPPTTGTYRLDVEPLRERVAWFGPPGHRPNDETEAPQIRIDPPSLAWELVALREPSLVLAGRDTTYTVVVRNVGSEAWDPALDDRISYELRDAETGERVSHGQRTALPRPVAPGEVIRLEMRVDTPRTAGAFELSVGLLREHVRWFHVDARPKLDFRVRRSSTLMLGLWCGLLVLGAAARWHSAGGRRWAHAVAAYAWPLWTIVQLVLLTVLFSDLSRFVLWEGAGLTCLGLAAAHGALVALVPARRRAPVAISVVSVWTLVALVDLSYARFFGGLAPLTAVLAVHHLWDAQATVGSTLEASWAWTLLIPGGALPVVVMLAGLEAPRHSRGHRIGLAAVLGLGGVLATGYLVKQVSSSLGLRVFSEAHNAQRFGLLGAHAFQALRLVRDAGGGDLSEQDEQAVFATLHEIRDARPTEALGVARGANLIIVQVEALQAWAVHAQVDGQPVMPFLSGQRTQGLFWDRIYDQTAQGRTSDAEYLVLASGHALDSGALAFLRADNDFRTNVHALADAGYATYSAHPYQRGFWNRSALHPRYGFERSEFRDAYGDGARVGWGLSDGAFLERFAERVSAMPEPFAAFAITLSLHHPYDDFPPGLRTMDIGELEDTWEGNYLHAMRHADDALAQLQATLEAQGLAERTVVLVYGDHVTGMRPTDAVVELAGETWTPDLRARMHRVPAFVWGPGITPGLSRAALGGQVDLGVTALHLLGVEPPAASVGMPLVGAGPQVVALPDGGAVQADRMLVRGGLDVPPEGRCVSLPDETVLPREACAEMESRATKQLSTARAVLNHDLYQAAKAHR